MHEARRCVAQARLRFLLCLTHVVSMSRDDQVKQREVFRYSCREFVGTGCRRARREAANHS